MSDFTKHARRRLSERTGLTETDLEEMVGTGALVDLGSKPGLTKVHYLFWSLKDDGAFIAIRDSLCGGWISILPIEYHKTLAWEINDDLIARAKELAEGHLNGTIGNVLNRVEPTVIKLYVRYITKSLDVLIKLIGKYPYHPYKSATEFLDDLTDDTLKEACTRHNISFNNVVGLIARAGAHSEAIRDI